MNELYFIYKMLKRLIGIPIGFCCILLGAILLTLGTVIAFIINGERGIGKWWEYFDWAAILSFIMWFFEE